MACSEGRVTCRWPWGKQVCSVHGREYMRLLNEAIDAERATGRPHRWILRGGEWVLVETETRQPRLTVVT